MPADRTWLGINLLTDLVNVLDVAIVRPRLASIDKEDGEIITGEYSLSSVSIRPSIHLTVRLIFRPSLRPRYTSINKEYGKLITGEPV